MSDKIDFVISWVDGNDPEWREKKNKALGITDVKKADTRNRRFRNWNNLVYLFRGISKYTPWVNHIFLVTPGQCPKWLNTDNPRVTVVNQDDLFEDKSLLPTFNNCAVELMFHRIPGLSEQFVYMNDDMFILAPTPEKDFFRNGLPCATISFSPALARFSEDGKGIYGIVTANTKIVAKHFKKEEVLRTNWKKYFDPRNGREIIKTLCCLPFGALVGFGDNMHIAYSFLKSTYEEVWAAESEELSNSSKERFRGEYALCHYAMRYWQMAKGTVSVRRRSFSKMFELHKLEDVEGAVHCITRGKPNMICINDDVEDEREFDEVVRRINTAFEQRFSEKCEFEY